MPSELQELIEFLHHGNTQIRQIAVENLVGYSGTDPNSFKINQLAPIKDLKLLVKDYGPISKNALVMLINLSTDQDVLTNLALDDDLLESLLIRITNAREPNADEVAMLLANLAKHDRIESILTRKRATVEGVSPSEYAIDQLMDCFVRGADGKLNKHANYNYLSYLFADLAKFSQGRSYLSTLRKAHDGVVPLTKLLVFTEHTSEIRRRGVASAIKNVAFDVESHNRLVADEVNILPYLLLPLMGAEEYADEDSEGMLDEVQLLPPDKEREKCNDIIKTHLETLLLLTTTKDVRDLLKRVKVYPIIREVHLQVEDDDVRESVDRLVQVIMRDEDVDKTTIEAEQHKGVVEVDSDEEVQDVL